MRRFPSPRLALRWCLVSIISLLAAHAGDVVPNLLTAPTDVSPAFRDFANQYFLADQLAEYDPATGAGRITWKRTTYTSAMNFVNMHASYQPVKANEWPNNIYEGNPTLPFTIEAVGPRTIRLRIKTNATPVPERESLMLVKAPTRDASWQATKIEGGYELKSAAGSVVLRDKPWRIEIRDAAGRLLTDTVSGADSLPFSFVRRVSDYSRSVGVVFSLAPGEKIFGCGESFGPFDKRGQKLVLATHDALGVERPEMYKPVPFFLSDRGYGMFIHTSTPITCDFGASHTSRNALLIGDDTLDLFIFLGAPKDILAAYTDLTGRPPMPPLWSFGLWMSRITYKSETEVRDVAAKIRASHIPADVIHLDTGWFETDWLCDYEFAKSRFTDPAKMITDLKADGFHISLWQLPYFVPKNRLFPEIVAKGLAVHDGGGGLPHEDAVLDFSNPATVAWYQEKLAGLLKLGVGAIKTDFGEAAPTNGLYASGRTGFYEHNLYPLRYQKAVADITHATNGEDIIWARAGWAGSQRYAVHWGGDAAKSFAGMAGTLRGGLSLGLSGFSFWSHDIGGFSGRNNIDVYRAWTPFGMLTSHSRVHGEPPKEPWLLGDDFLAEFRRSAELRYRLMPYIYAQAKDCSERGLPMVRALFVEYPDDPGAWLVDDEYLFGSSMLVAPLFEAGITARNVYLPAGRWIDYQSGKVFDGGWQRIEIGAIPAIILVRDGTILPHLALAQSTAQMDWKTIELAVFASEAKAASGLLCLPSDNRLVTLDVERKGAGFVLKNDPLAGKITWQVHSISPTTP